MKRKLTYHPIIVWSFFMIIAVPAFLWQFFLQLKEAIVYAWYDSFVSAAEHAKYIIKKGMNDER